LEYDQNFVIVIIAILVVLDEVLRLQLALFTIIYIGFVD